MESHRSVWLAAVGLIGAIATVAAGTAGGLYVADSTGWGFAVTLTLAALLYVACFVILGGLLYDHDWVPQGRLTRNASAAKNLGSSHRLAEFKNELDGLNAAPDDQIVSALARVTSWIREQEPDLLDAFLSDTGIGGLNPNDSEARQELHKRRARVGELFVLMHNRAETGG